MKRFFTTLCFTCVSVVSLGVLTGCASAPVAPVEIAQGISVTKIEGVRHHIARNSDFPFTIKKLQKNAGIVTGTLNYTSPNGGFSSEPATIEITGNSYVVKSRYRNPNADHPVYMELQLQADGKTLSGTEKEKSNEPNPYGTIKAKLQ